MRAKYIVLLACVCGNERFAVFLLARPFVCYTDFILFLSFSILKRVVVRRSSSIVGILLVFEIYSPRNRSV